MTRFYLTGRVAVEGARVVDQAELAGRQGRLALVKLTVERHRPVPTSELAAAIWGDAVPTSGEVSLRAIVSKLRSTLAAADADATISSEAGCYQLRAPGAWVDVEEAANAVDRAEGAWRRDELAVAWAHAAVASAIARRPPLPGEDAPWIAELQQQTRRLHVRALTVLTQVFRRRRDHGLAVSTAQELVAFEPFRESGHRLLMQAHLAAGNDAEAVRAYEACRRLLAEELGVDPSRQTEALHRQAIGAG